VSLANRTYIGKRVGKIHISRVYFGGNNEKNIILGKIEEMGLKIGTSVLLYFFNCN